MPRDAIGQLPFGRVGDAKASRRRRMPQSRTRGGARAGELPGQGEPDRRREGFDPGAGMGGRELAGLGDGQLALGQVVADGATVARVVG